jgi:tRNA modification GTPase
MITEDTIAALATASGPGAISIVRLSGSDSLAIADRLFHCTGVRPSERPGGSFVYGRIGLPGDGVVDEGILLIFRAPRSYTREDVVEIQCHGGRESARRILRLVLEAGARSAEPGEFTRRAFLNGRLDLVQAEAVMDLIASQSARAASSAVEQLAGRLSESVRAVYSRVVMACSDLEATLDFPEEDFPDDLAEQSVQHLDASMVMIDDLLVNWEEGHRLREGALVVISGQPNAGKSTLLNRLLGKDRAIVSPVPGTTRDSIEETFVLNGIPIRLVDTAGLRDTGCAVEQEGIARAKVYIEKADLRLHVVDASLPFSPADLTSLVETAKQQTIVLFNKTDLKQVVSHCDFVGYEALSISLIKEYGINALLEVMTAKLDANPHAPPHATLSERHRGLLTGARHALLEARQWMVPLQQKGLVPAASHLREAADLLGRIIGRVYYDDMLDQIFSRFCIGK